MLENRKTPIEYGKAACETIMNSYEAPCLPPYRKDEKQSVFTYHQGVFLSGMSRIFEKTGDTKLIQYIKDWVDATLDQNGKITELGGWVSTDTLDFRQPGILMFPLYERTHDEKYLNIARYLAETLADYPTNSQGGFWHMITQENQMWLDGLYMVGPLMAMYADKFGKVEFFDMASNQILVMYENMYDEKSGLLIHAWDESKKSPWADAYTGKSQTVWGRAMGWYVTAIADILDYLPKTHKNYDRIVSIEAEMLNNLAKYQDQRSGRWYEVTNQVERAGNWLENSSSCLFVYAFSKALRKGYIDSSCFKIAEFGYNGIINSLTYDENSNLLIGEICIGTCVDEGTYEHYISREKCINDLHGVGAFVLMCSEYQNLSDYLLSKH